LKLFRGVKYVVVRILRLGRSLFRFGVKTYDGILISMTQMCNKGGFIGEVVLIPVALAWMAWPMLIPQYLKGN